MGSWLLQARGDLALAAHQIDVGLVHQEAVGGLCQLLRLGLEPSMGQGQYDELQCWHLSPLPQTACLRLLCW